MTSEQEDDTNSLIHSTDLEAVRNQVALDGKRIGSFTTSSSLVTALVGVPVWLTVVLPLSVVYQTAKKVLGSSDSEEQEENSVDNEKEEEAVSFPSVSELKSFEDRTYDIVLLGCTGFTGGLVASYLAKNYNDKGIKWAIAGRSQKKMDQLKLKLSKDAKDSSLIDSLDTIVVDTSKKSTLHNLVKDTRVLITTAGPFCKYGSNVVEFCANYGTHYIDSTGETDWNKIMIMEHEDKARETGAKIVSLCGCDSIPWDLSVYKLTELMRKECNDELVHVKCYDETKGGISGGTVDTMLQFVEGKFKPRKYSFDPYYRTSTGEKSKFKTKDESSPWLQKYKEDGKWTMPWVMGTINYEVVKRTRALDPKVENDFTYEEFWRHHSFNDAFPTWFGTVFGVTALMNPLSGSIMKKIIPKPGQGPTDKQMKHGYLLVSAEGEGRKGSKVESEFYFPGDPGYSETARMLAESALSLAIEGSKVPSKRGGFFSPAAALGDVLLKRLCKSGSKYASRVVVKDGKLKSKL